MNQVTFFLSEGKIPNIRKKNSEIIANFRLQIFPVSFKESGFVCMYVIGKKKKEKKSVKSSERSSPA